MRAFLVPFAVAATLAAACAGAPPGQGAPQPERLYRQRCSSCHRPYEPSTRTRAQWDAALARMAPRAHLSPGEEAALRRWLEAGASDAGAAR